MNLKHLGAFSGSLLASTLALTSCLPPETSSTADTAGSNTTVSDAAVNDTTVSNTMAVDINGSWKDVDCEVGQIEDGTQLYTQSISTINVPAQTAVWTESSYSDSNCLILIEELDSLTSWFTLGEIITTDSGMAALEMNIFDAEEMVTPFYYQIISIDSDFLYYGLITDVGADTPETRPTSLDFENPLTTALLSLDENCGDVTIAEMNWASASLLANIDKIILTEGYDCNAELVIGETISTSTSMIEKGVPDIAPEMWTGSNEEVLERAIADKKIRYAGRSLSDGGEEGFWIPQYMVDEFPEMATIEGVLKHKELFINPDDPDTLRFMGCPIDWNCQISTTHLFEALELEEAGFELVDPGSGSGLADSIANAYEREEGWFGYYWSPTALLGRYKMSKVDFGTGVDAAHFKKCILDKDCINPQVTMFPPSDVWTVVGETFAARGGPIMVYLAKRSITRDQTNELLAWMEDNQVDGASGAMYFLEKYPALWKQWVSDVAAEKVISAL